MSRFPHGHFHVNGDPIFYGPGRFGPVVLTNPDPRFPPGWQREQGVPSSAPAPSEQHPPTRPVASARHLPPPSATGIPRSESSSRRPVSQSAALSSMHAVVLGLPESAFPSHSPAPFAAAVAETVRTGLQWPASVPSYVVSADQVAPPCADATDAWHVTSRMMYYPRRHSYNTEVPITVTFAPTHGPGLMGVAMTELVRARGLKQPDTPIVPRSQAGATGRLIFEWPGYDMQTYPLLLQDGKGRYAPRVALGAQIATALHAITEKFADPNEFTPGTGVMQMPLGRHGIRYERLRLLEAISFNGQDFYVHIGIVPHRITPA
ncbi:hypothetical protein GGX14DRAFT_566342 [Mycena pura]|uniref:Uncharacterized protein n=1 Tax=Mycena pura TaxID=153505 RepID=A0AAD6VJY4_9AGAR|nr:hypothetical protein GGX14DRAFT_566342 [Mycena pura]